MDALIVSQSVDTNGENFRFAQAAAKYGTDERILNVLNLSNGRDIAGIGAALSHASRRHPKAGLSIRSVHRRSTYFNWPSDINWLKQPRLVARLFREADVVHLNNRDAAYRKLVRVTKRRPPGVLHHHGTPFRRRPEVGLEAAHQHRFLSAVSTLDLTQPAPDDLHWLPSPINAAAMRDIRAEHRREPDGTVLVVTAPTNRQVKSTALLIKAVEQLQAEGLPVALDIVENLTHADCLKRKAKADIYFDQVLLGYGCNAVEAWSMGIPVIAGAQPYTLNRMKQEFGVLPFYRANTSSITEALRALVTFEELRDEYGQRGAQHVARYHDELPVLERLATLYQKAIALR